MKEDRKFCTHTAEGEEALPSPVSQAVKDLSQRVRQAIGKRERLPQPLFWSLFNAEISDIRTKKAEQRLLDRLFDDIVE